jgi:hypothetical protein
MATAFVAVYRGPTVASARLVAVSSDPRLVADVASRLLREPSADGDDPATTSIDRGRRAALRVIRRDASATRAQP